MKKLIWRGEDGVKEPEYIDIELVKDINWIVIINKDIVDIRITEDPICNAIQIRGTGRDSLSGLIDYLHRVQKDIDAGYTGFVEE